MKLNNKHLLFIVCSVFLVVLICFYVNSCNKAKNVVVAHNDNSNVDNNVKENNNKKSNKKIWSNVNKLQKNNNKKNNKSENVKDFNHNDVHSDKANFNSQSTLGEPENWEMSGVYWHSAKAATKGM